MVTRAKSVCRRAACGKLIDVPGYCEAHAKQMRRESDAKRGSSSERGYDGRWQKARVAYLRGHPLCVHCMEDGIPGVATEVDHIKPHRLKQAIDSGIAALVEVAQALFWDHKNWQGLCKRHHDIKTATEDGGFGRKQTKV